MISFDSFCDEFEKISARRGLKEIAKLVQQGEHAAASRLAKTRGVLKPSVAGSSFKELGMGAEGAASLVAHPEHGVSVRKHYNPGGISSPAMIARKELAGRAIGQNPNLAQFHGSATTPQGHAMHFSEYVPGQTASSAGITKKNPEFQRARGGAIQALRGAGFRGGEDIRPGNMIRDVRTGGLKTVDYLPSRQGEFAKAPKRVMKQWGSNTVVNTPSGRPLFNPTPSPLGSSQRDVGRLKAWGFRGVQPVATPPPLTGTPTKMLPTIPRPSAVTNAPTVAKPPSITI